MFVNLSSFMNCDGLSAKILFKTGLTTIINMPPSIKTPSFEVIEKLRTIYLTNKWEVDERGSFNRFCEMLGLLTADQQDCILKLTEHFLKVDFDIYRYYIKNAISKMDVISINEYSRIYILPINAVEQKIEGEKKVELRKAVGTSSVVIAYTFNDSDIKDQEPLRGRNLFVISSLEGLPRNFRTSKCMLLLVDDFIGSGETFERCISFLTSTLMFPVEKLHVLSLVGQREGIEKLQAMNITVYCPEIRPKGISENYLPPYREQLTSLMEQIEDMLQIDKEFQFGYMRSEALVKMIRTPNNTFPIFWHNTTTKSGEKYSAPFPR